MKFSPEITSGAFDHSATTHKSQRTYACREYIQQGEMIDSSSIAEDESISGINNSHPAVNK